MDRELVVCSCGNTEHQIIFTTFPDEDFVSATIHLTKLSFLQRLKLGIKYIFGYQSRYGAFDEIILDKSHISSLEKVINKLKETNG